jgi:SAM-dependent methyltransferase
MKEYLQNNLSNAKLLIDDIEKRRPFIGWINKCIPNNATILNIGCYQGNETRALSIILEPKIIIGLDIIEYNLQCARINSFQIVNAFNKAIEYCIEEKELFINFKRFIELPHYIVGDITSAVGLRNDVIDLVYCKRVLCNTFSNKEQAFTEIPFRKTIKNIKRILRPKGKIIALEPTDCTKDINEVERIEQIFLEEGYDETTNIVIPKYIENHNVYLFSK